MLLHDLIGISGLRAILEPLDDRREANDSRSEEDSHEVKPAPGSIGHGLLLRKIRLCVRMEDTWAHNAYADFGGELKQDPRARQNLLNVILVSVRLGGILQQIQSQLRDLPSCCFCKLKMNLLEQGLLQFLLDPFGVGRGIVEKEEPRGTREEELLLSVGVETNEFRR